MRFTRAMFFKWKPTKYKFLSKVYVAWLWWEIEFKRNTNNDWPAKFWA